MSKKNKFYLLSIFSLISIVIINSCDGIPDDIVDNPVSDESIMQINVPSAVSWNTDDSSFVASILLADTRNIDSLHLKIINNLGENELGLTFLLQDDGESESGDETAGDNIYSAKPYMMSSMANGNYKVEFYKTHINGLAQRIALIPFEYDNGQRNYPPVISDLDMPTNISRGQDFIIHLTVTDQNGIGNIQSVVFTLKRPDGTSSMNGNSPYFPMYDNGDTAGSGDNVSGDGIFSLKNSFGNTAQIGPWTFEFRAFDKAGEESNIITSSIVVD